MKSNTQGQSPQGNRLPTRNQAKAAAAMLAGVVYDRDPAGKLVQVTNTKARDLLARAFAQLILRGGKPFAMQISASEAAAFPSHTPVAGGSYALAVGFDLQDRATFSTAGAAAVCDDRPVDAALVAEHVAMMGLVRGQQIVGIPARGRA